MANIKVIYHLKTGQKITGQMDPRREFSPTALTVDTIHKVCSDTGNCFVQGDNIAYVEVPDEG